MAKVILQAGTVILSNTVDNAAVSDISAFAVANYKDALGADQSSALAVRDWLRATFSGMKESVRRWKQDQAHKAVQDTPSIPSTED